MVHFPRQKLLTVCSLRSRCQPASVIGLQHSIPESKEMLARQVSSLFAGGACFDAGSGLAAPVSIDLLCTSGRGWLQAAQWIRALFSQEYMLIEGKVGMQRRTYLRVEECDRKMPRWVVSSDALMPIVKIHDGMHWCGRIRAGGKEPRWTLTWDSLMQILGLRAQACRVCMEMLLLPTWPSEPTRKQAATPSGSRMPTSTRPPRMRGALLLSLLSSHSGKATLTEIACRQSQHTHVMWWGCLLQCWLSSHFARALPTCRDSLQAITAC